jgi:hypothetical protein
MGRNSPEYSRAYYERNKERVKAKAAEGNRNQRRRHRIRIYEYLLQHPCVDCGETDPLVLEFDHRDPSQKLFSVANGANQTWSWEKIEAEIAKCDVRCANCHRRRTKAQHLEWYEGARVIAEAARIVRKQQPQPENSAD